MTIVFASDHAGLHLRRTLEERARALGHGTVSVGAQSEEAYDYPDAADEGVQVLLSGQAEFGVFVCGSGTGICIRANRFAGIRAANCTTVEQARLARQHNHANVLCLGERLVPTEIALEAMEAFLTEPEDTAPRHERRVLKLDGNEKRD